MILGIDTSTYFEEINNGARYYGFGHREVDPLDEFVKNGVTYQRIRL